MSRIGKQQLHIPSGVEVTIDAHSVRVKGPKGELARSIREEVALKNENGVVTSSPRRNDKFSRALWGTYMSHVKNMITGVQTPFEKKLLIEGVGFRWEVKGSDLHLSLGFSHPVTVKAPHGVEFKVEKNKITVSGIDKSLVGQVAAKVRSYKPPEPYKGKGIFYKDEKIIRKAGKKAAAG